MLRSETGTQCTELLNLYEISEFGKGKHLLKMFLTALLVGYGIKRDAFSIEAARLTQVKG